MTNPSENSALQRLLYNEYIYRSKTIIKVIVCKQRENCINVKILWGFFSLRSNYFHIIFVQFPSNDRKFDVKCSIYKKNVLCIVKSLSDMARVQTRTIIDDYYVKNICIFFFLLGKPIVSM